MRQRPPTSTLFPYTTLFRSDLDAAKAIPLLERAVVTAESCGHDRVVARAAAQLVYANKRTDWPAAERSEEHTSELQSQFHLVCRLLLEKKKKHKKAQNASPA